MYHARFKGTHYEIGQKWGARLLRYGKYLLDNVPFQISPERIAYSKQCRPFYEKYYPDILEEIRGIAEGQEIEPDRLEAVLLNMYCIMPENKCSCFAFREGNHILLARNSDFLTEIEDLYMNCIYRFTDSGNSFMGNTTAFVEMEDGVNEHGLAIGLTSVYPKVLGYGLNAGMLLRYGLEKCRTVEEFVQALERLPIASSQTFTAVDREGTAVVIECNSHKVEICRVGGNVSFVSAVNEFHTEGMKEYLTEGIDTWNAGERYETIQTAFQGSREKEAVPFAMDVLKGRYGFICQYDRCSGKDTVWSVVYDVGEGKIYRCEGNPSRRKYVEDRRFFLQNRTMGIIKSVE